MTRTNTNLLRFLKNRHSKTILRANLFFRRWEKLCDLYLPIKSENSVWRFSRSSRAEEPSQGWKLHISATILDACDLFEKVAPGLIARDVQFKAPKSLEILSKINSGLEFGYWQIGKFITVYPNSEKQAVRLARRIHNLTKEFVSISVPFDEQYLPESSVFYRYGAFSAIEITNENGRKVTAIKNPAGKLVEDNRLRAVPEWLSDPFNKNGQTDEKSFAETPLGTTYKIFCAITQRGKGGTYQAFDFSKFSPRLCIVKEGKRFGEIGWNGQDGYYLLKNELQALQNIRKKNPDVPRVLASFEVCGNFYLAMEYVEGKSLHDLMKLRRRRFSIRQVVKLGLEITKLIERIHQAGWIWNDCKPANIIITKDKSLRPVDFEGAYRVHKTAPFDWKTKGFAKLNGASARNNSKIDDVFALGAVVYFLLTGNLYDADDPKPISSFRRNVPKELIKITENLLFDAISDISEARTLFEAIKDTKQT